VTSFSREQVFETTALGTVAEWTADHKQMAFTRFDPVAGPGHEFTSLDGDSKADIVVPPADGDRIAAS
jgi:hypothetical protein